LANQDKAQWLGVGFVLEHDGEQIQLLANPELDGRLVVARGFAGTFVKTHPVSSWRVAATPITQERADFMYAAVRGWICDTCGGPNADDASRCRWCKAPGK
jgi:ribosomal protein L40E